MRLAALLVHFTAAGSDQFVVVASRSIGTPLVRLRLWEQGVVYSEGWGRGAVLSPRPAHMLPGANVPSRRQPLYPWSGPVPSTLPLLLTVRAHVQLFRADEESDPASQFPYGT